jgi:hypothetical protein
MNQEDVMRANLAKLPPRTFMLLTVSVLAIAYPLVTIVLPSLVRALLPEAVRSVLHLL